MILVGISWVLYWALIDVFGINALKAALVTGIVFVLLGLAYEGRGYLRLPDRR